jgi:hypothetical protein
MVKKSKLESVVFQRHHLNNCCLHFWMNKGDTIVGLKIIENGFLTQSQGFEI